MSLTFYPETELYFRAKKEGIIKDDLNDIYRKFYKECKQTYINKLFYLLKKYTSNGYLMPTSLMLILTNKMLRKTRLNWLLYALLYLSNYFIRVFYTFKILFDDIQHNKMNIVKEILYKSKITNVKEKFEW